MQSISDPNPYKDKVFGQLLSMQIGESFNVKENVAPERRQLFINCVCEFIDLDNGKFKKFYIEFSNDYSSLKKFEYSKVVLEKEKEKPQAITDEMLKQIEDYFSTALLPSAIRISDHENILDVKKFVKSHLSYVRQNRGFTNYYSRLVELKKILETK